MVTGGGPVMHEGMLALQDVMQQLQPQRAAILCHFRSGISHFRFRLCFFLQ